MFNKNENVLKIDKIKSENNLLSYEQSVIMWFSLNELEINDENIDLYLPRDLIIYRIENDNKPKKEVVVNEELKKLIGMSDIDRVIEIEDMRIQNIEDESYITAVTNFLDKYLLDIKKSNINKYIPQTIIDRLENESTMNGSLKGRHSYKFGK